MKRTLLSILAILVYAFTYGQSFEGTLTYKVELEFKTMKIGDYEISKEVVIEKMKEDGDYYDTITVTIKDGNYLKRVNSKPESIVIYRSEENKIYTFQNDYESNRNANNYNTLGMDFDDPKLENLDTVKTIAGIECKLLRLSWGELGDEYYYYNSDIASLNPELFKKHNFEYLNTVVSNTHSYPLEIVKTLSSFMSAKMTLVTISEDPVSDDLFDVKKIRQQIFLRKQNRKTNWSVFEDEKIGYSIEYPENWFPNGGKGGFMCGEKSGFTNAEFTIYWSKVRDRERMDLLFNDANLYEDYDVIEKPIIINGIEGTYYLRTHKDKPSEYHETIILKTKKIWYSIDNSGIKNHWFEHFYNSFKLLK